MYVSYSDFSYVLLEPSIPEFFKGLHSFLSPIFTISSSRFFLNEQLNLVRNSVMKSLIFCQSSFIAWGKELKIYSITFLQQVFLKWVTI